MFKDIIFLERDLESAKVELALKPDFNLIDAFKMLDMEDRGYISHQDLAVKLHRYFEIDTLSLHGEENLYLFMKRFDPSMSGRLTFAELCRAFTPIAKEYASLVEGRAEFYAKKFRDPLQFFN